MTTSSKPIWVTKPGNLGTVPEEIFYATVLEAFDDTNAGRPILFETISGQMPPGIHLDGFGILTGSPLTTQLLVGVPFDVPQAVTNKFAVRARVAEYAEIFSGDGSTTQFELNTNVDYTIYKVQALVDGQPKTVEARRSELDNETVTVIFNRAPVAGTNNIIIALYTIDSKVADRTFEMTVVGENPPVIKDDKLVAGNDGTIVSGTNVFSSNVSNFINADVTSGDLLSIKFGVDAGSYIVFQLNSGTELTVVTSADFTGWQSTASDLVYDITKNIGTIIEGSFFDFTVPITDTDREDTHTYSIGSGSLPPGLVLNPSTGRISGIIEIIPPQDYISNNKSYIFSVIVSDGKITDSKEYVINVYPISVIDASKTNFTVDATFITIDLSGDVGDPKKHRPFILTPAGIIAEVTHDNYFLFKFDGFDVDGDALTYELLTGIGQQFDDIGVGFDEGVFDEQVTELPGGFTLDADTGWLRGNFGPQSETTILYEFFVRAFKRDVFVTAEDGSTLLPYRSERKKFGILVKNLEAGSIIWGTDSDLGTIPNGSVSELRIRASNTNENTIFFELLEGEYNKLPPGLRLQSNGLITGRATFSIFSLDGGATTFDRTSLFTDETTIDQTYTINVRAYDIEGTANDAREFTVRIDRSNALPYENLYLVSRLPLDDRSKLGTVLADTDVVPVSSIYRSNDSYFGLARDLRVTIATGLYPKTAEEYATAMQKNHSWKQLKFGDIKSARVLNPADNSVRYEVVYVEVIDDLKSDKNRTVNLEIPGPNNDIPVLYPNTLAAMRRRIFQDITQVNKALPAWMIDKQEDGKVLGFTPACILAYVLPNEGEKIAFRIASLKNLPKTNPDYFDIKDFNFIVDRYVWDTDLLANFDKETLMFRVTPETTFDVFTGKAINSVFCEDSVTVIYPLPPNYPYEPNSYQTATGDGATTVFNLDFNVPILGAATTVGQRTNLEIKKNGLTLSPTQYSTARLSNDVTRRRVTFTSAPLSGEELEFIVFNLPEGYHVLTVDNGSGIFTIDASTKSFTIKVNGVVVDEIEYTVVQTANGTATITFATPPAIGNIVEFIPNSLFNATRTSSVSPTEWGADTHIGSQYINDPFKQSGTVTTTLGTRFDASSMRFLEFKDKYAEQDVRDKYLAFPKRNILS